MEPTIRYHQYPDFFYAGFWIRVVAYLIDLLMIGSITRLINGPLSIATGGVNEWTVLHLTIGAVLFVYPLYFILFTGFTGGQTLGKMITGIRVVSFTEESLSWKTILVRELFGRYIQKMVLFLYLITAFTPKKQHAADLLSDTAVISENAVTAFLCGQSHARIPRTTDGSGPAVTVPDGSPAATASAGFPATVVMGDVPPEPVLPDNLESPVPEKREPKDADPIPPVTYIRADRF